MLENVTKAILAGQSAHLRKAGGFSYESPRAAQEMGGSERTVRCMTAARRSHPTAAPAWVRPRETGEESHHFAATWLSCPTPSIRFW